GVHHDPGRPDCVRRRRRRAPAFHGSVHPDIPLVRTNMPRTRSLAWSELKVGVLTIVAIAVASVLIFTLTGTRGFFWQRYSLKTRFGNVAGLAVGSPVRVAGVEVGSVKSILITGEQVDVGFEVNKAERERITTASV